MESLYHGSKTPNIKTLRTHPHNVVNGESVVFATNDPLFAMAMMYGTGNQLAVGYFVGTKSRIKNMYVDELEKGSLKLLENSGYLYEVADITFKRDKRLMREEFISYTDVKVIKETAIPHILNYLKSNNVEIVGYTDVPKAMKARNKDIDSPISPHAKNRFNPID